jgi:hypothetical protein
LSPGFDLPTVPLHIAADHGVVRHRGGALGGRVVDVRAISAIVRGVGSAAQYRPDLAGTASGRKIGDRYLDRHLEDLRLGHVRKGGQPWMRSD